NFHIFFLVQACAYFIVVVVDVLEYTQIISSAFIGWDLLGVAAKFLFHSVPIDIWVSQTGSHCTDKTPASAHLLARVFVEESDLFNDLVGLLHRGDFKATSLKLSHVSSTPILFGE